MIKNLKIHALLWIIAYFIFLVRQIVYCEFTSDVTYQVGVVYLIVILLVLLLNLIDSRLKKWLVIFCLYIIPLSILLCYDTPGDYTLIYVITTVAPVNIPILPDNTWQYITHSEYSIRVFYQYLVFFILPIFYWVGLYYLSKYLVARYFTKSKDKSI